MQEWRHSTHPRSVSRRPPTLVDGLAVIADCVGTLILFSHFLYVCQGSRVELQSLPLSIPSTPLRSKTFMNMPMSEKVCASPLAQKRPSRVNPNLIPSTQVCCNSGKAA
ncbi:hypothetical protein LX32DRAFT_303956 [Colletotrichum zoysiae]|uniref:Uncharacterized protein n=1 Tax=Colletotrichum zoysiae TaxID=1216348 RepID=A0AAD9HKR8_9PEZI|nr:hypothetical protein LX32DRAFT_303956 [Colletotrichum zoysiae]